MKDKVQHLRNADQKASSFSPLDNPASFSKHKPLASDEIDLGLKLLRSQFRRCRSLIETASFDFAREHQIIDIDSMWAEILNNADALSYILNRLQEKGHDLTQIILREYIETIAARHRRFREQPLIANRNLFSDCDLIGNSIMPTSELLSSGLHGEEMCTLLVNTYDGATRGTKRK